MKVTGEMNKLGCHRVIATDKGKGGLSHVFTAETTSDALWLYNFFQRSKEFTDVKILDASGAQWKVGLHVSARLMKLYDKHAVTFDDPELERLHSENYLEQ